ncbi:MAG: hypothetical protein ACO1QR_06085, partial [Chthoniobacteraceae bacterium]
MRALKRHFAAQGHSTHALKLTGSWGQVRLDVAPEFLRLAIDAGLPPASGQLQRMSGMSLCGEMPLQRAHLTGIISQTVEKNDVTPFGALRRR